MSTLAHIRQTINTADEYYDSEQAYWDEYSPLYDELNTNFYKELVDSRFRAQLEERLGKQFFTLAELSLKAFSPEVIEELQVENKLCSEYSKLIASAKIMFEGEERNLSALIPFTQSRDREMRKKALDAALESNNLLKKEIKEKEELIKDLDAYARSVAHDLKNPIYGLLGISDLVKDFIQNQKKVRPLKYWN
jgi:oligoendopeptidase F